MKRVEVNEINNVDFVGELTGYRKLEAYSQASLYVLPTFSENFGISVAEALAAGVPAIVTKGAPWGEIESRNAGWWIDVGRAPLERALRVAFDVSEQKLEEMGACGRRWMDDSFSWASLSRRMSALYAWLTGKGPKPDTVHLNR